MPELTQKERLQPALLDRLTDDEPDQREESRDKRVLSLRRLRELVLRDMTWLLNTGSLDSALDLENYPEVARSVLNYGMRDLSGVVISGVDLPAIERRIKQAILDFEPRILPHSLKVQVTASEHMSSNAMVFAIEGELWAQPLPIHLYIKTEIDLETGTVDLRDVGG